LGQLVPQGGRMPRRESLGVHAANGAHQSRGRGRLGLNGLTPTLWRSVFRALFPARITETAVAGHPRRRRSLLEGKGGKVIDSGSGHGASPVGQRVSG
jgi:hypothetical protein